MLGLGLYQLYYIHTIIIYYYVLNLYCTYFLGYIVNVVKNHHCIFEPCREREDGDFDLGYDFYIIPYKEKVFISILIICS